MGNKNPMEFITSHFSGKEKGKKLNLLILIGAFGILLVILSNTFSPEKPDVNISTEPEINTGTSSSGEQQVTTNINTTEKAMAARLEDSLSQISGVGQVKATVNIASTTEYEYAINTTTTNKQTEEQDQKGGNRTVTEVNEDGQLVLIREGEGNRETPVIKKEIKPEVQGVMIVAEGADDPEIKAQLIEAVQVYLNVLPHRVVVLPKESR